MPGLGEELLGAGDVLLALREVVCETRIVDAVEVIADRAVAAEHLFDHLLAVHSQPEGLSDALVVERRAVHAHGERQPHAGFRVEDLHARVRVQDLQQRQRDLADGVHLGGEQGVDQRIVIVEVEDRQLVQVGLAIAPIVVIAGEDAALSGREGLDLEWAGSHRLGRVVVCGHDAQGVLPERVVEG